MKPDDLFVVDRTTKKPLRSPVASKSYKQSQCTPLFFLAYDRYDVFAFLLSFPFFSKRGDIEVERVQGRLYSHALAKRRHGDPPLARRGVCRVAPGDDQRPQKGRRFCLVQQH